MSFTDKNKEIKLGIIGMTEGNGHPYSWSAIFNGYDEKIMTAECPYTGIPLYLNKEPKETLQIRGAKVSHIYCDNRKDAEHVAKCSFIPNIADTPYEMIGTVDAVIIATDIGSEHVERSRPFVEANIPVFIDKPLCDNLEDLKIFRKWIVDEKRPVMSSSCMRYAGEYMPYHKSTGDLGELRFVSITMSKKWETYGIHALEAIYPILGPGFETIQNLGSFERNIVHMTHKRGADIIIACIKDIQYGGALRLAGTQGSVEIRSTDTFSAFKSQLQAFIDFLHSGEHQYPFSETRELMELVIGGIQSREKNGKKISLNELSYGK